MKQNKKKHKEKDKCIDIQNDQWGLYDATLNCPGYIYDAPGGGVKCDTCSGWFCF